MATKNDVTATQSLTWRAGKKPLIRIDAQEGKAIIVPTRCDADELAALATAATEAAKVLREASKPAAKK
ncbi:MAG TPA: hypothetical protein VGK58_17005 [Lacipirellulaceae bacterium]